MAQTMEGMLVSMPLYERSSRLHHRNGKHVGVTPTACRNSRHDLRLRAAAPTYVRDVTAKALFACVSWLMDKDSDCNRVSGASTGTVPLIAASEMSIVRSAVSSDIFDGRGPPRSGFVCSVSSLWAAVTSTTSTDE